MQIEVLNHASIKITSDKIYYFDPYKIDKKVSDADYIFITHDHYDHFDYNSIKNVINENTMLIVSACLEEKVKEITNNYTIVYPSCKYEIATLHFDTVPSYNIGKSFHLKEMNYVGYIVNIKNNKVYVMGDTDVIDEIKDISCDICFVPIGGTYTMNYKEASDYINKINPKEVIPIHYGSIVGNRDLGLKFSELVNSNINVKVFIK